jgi:pimeloyl-ACP methyl ester carboxylesterase
LRLWSCALVLLWCGGMLLGTSGCTGDKFLDIRKRPYNPLEQQLNLVPGKAPEPTDRTRQLLRRFDLLKPYEKDAAVALAELSAEITRDPAPEKLHAFAELSYVQGKRAEGMFHEDDALDLYGASVAHAYWYLLDPDFDRFRNPYDPHFRRACDLYNGALEASLRLVKKQGKLLPEQTTTIETGRHQYEIKIVCRGSWKAADIERLEFVNDYQVKGLINQYHTYGLGVPLIAVRKSHPGLDRAEKYYPPGLSFAVTAFLRVMHDSHSGTADDGKVKHCVLELHDPLRATDIEVANRRVPLESDLSMPLAFYLNSPRLKEKNFATRGLLDTNLVAPYRGIYMLEPYDPNKIPVIMVHGLWSSPLTWMEMFNDLRALPEIRERYQFWFYLYPTGQPFWTSAAGMRQDLAEMRELLDPQRESPTLDQMVLVGHSMGGLVSRLQTLQSGDDFWHIISDRPFSELDATDEERQALAAVCFFQPNPSVQRVITLATPHRGSNFANDFTRYAGQWLIALPQKMVITGHALVRKNPGFFHHTDLLTTTTSIDSLAPDSPIFPIYLAAPKGTGVKYHNIVGEFPKEEWFSSLSRGSDGIVPFQSAHMDDVESEIVVSATHTGVHRHPRAVLEVRRILLMHEQEVLAKWRALENPAPAYVQQHDESVPSDEQSFELLPVGPTVVPVSSEREDNPASFLPPPVAPVYRSEG